MSVVKISQRAFARIITFSVAVSAVLAVYAAGNGIRAARAERAVENTYMNAVEDLSLNLDNIKNNLRKGMYTNSISMLSDLSEKLSDDAKSAKNSLARLPVDELDLIAAYRFLSQVGNYSRALAEKCAEGSRLSEDDRGNIAALHAYAEELSGNMWDIEKRIETGKITLAATKKAASQLKAGDPVNVTSGFTDFPANDNSYPTLIYDGPYSDHIMEKSPLMIKNEKEISEDEALRRAKKVVDSDDLKLLTVEKGKMPSYVFSDGSHTVAITKAGGLYSYMLSTRKAEKAAITAEEAVKRAQAYLSELGIRGLTDSYYEIRNGICIVNLAAEQNGVTMYTDLIKAGVALDTGEIVSFDMRGYITNPTIRDLPAPRISSGLAETLISSELSPVSTKLCVIPSEGQNEIFYYEVRCIGKSGENVLVYLNAQNGREEQILILKIGRGGVLTV